MLVNNNILLKISLYNFKTMSCLDSFELNPLATSSLEEDNMSFECVKPVMTDSVLPLGDRHTNISIMSSDSLIGEIDFGVKPKNFKSSTMSSDSLIGESDSGIMSLNFKPGKMPINPELKKLIGKLDPPPSFDNQLNSKPPVPLPMSQSIQQESESIKPRYPFAPSPQTSQIRNYVIYGEDTLSNDEDEYDDGTLKYFGYQSNFQCNEDEDEEIPFDNDLSFASDLGYDCIEWSEIDKSIK